MAHNGFALEGARVLLTGASSGIGRALALALAQEGAQLVLVARREAVLTELADILAKQHGARAVVLLTDLGQAGAAARVAAAAERELGGIDVLVNNAGVSIIGAQHIVGDGEPARTLFETNYWSPLALIAALAPGMRQRGRGCIVNVTSTLQAVPMPLVGYYSASKTAFARSTQVLRHELRDAGVRVMEVVPGGTDTPTRHQDRLLPLRRKLPEPPLVAPESTAKAIVRGLRNGAERVVHPASSLLPLELPSIGRLIARVAAHSIDTSSDQVVIP